MSTRRAAVANPFADLSLEQLRRRTSAKWQYYPDDVLPLWVAEMDAIIAAPIADAVKEALNLGDTGYPASRTYPEAMASFATDRWDWSFDPAVAVQMPDVMSGIREIVRAISTDATSVVLTPPVYPPFYGVAKTLGLPIVLAPLTDEGRLDPAALESAFREATSDGGNAVLLLSNPHNPTGTVHSRDELETVARLSRQYGARVVSDEIHSPLIMPTSTFTPYLSVADSATDFTVASASKGWNLAGFKAAVVVPGSEAVKDLEVPSFRGAGHAGLIGVIAHAAAFNHARDWLDAAISGIDENRRLLADLLATHLPEAKYRMPESTYLAWIDCRALGLGDDPAAVFLEKSRVALNSGLTFGELGAGHVRLNLATSPEILTEAVTRMGAVRN
jgi:cystathionine beta-lyase